MSEKFQCGDNPALAGYLYDECEPDEQAAIAAHVAVCAACAAELAALESTRTHLASWAPPEADLGFQIVRPETGRILQPAFAPAPWWRQPMPGWAQAAAAVLIFAAGIAIGVARSAGLNDGAGLNGGVMNGAAPMTAAAPDAAAQAQAPAAATAAVSVSAQDLAALEQRLRAEIVQARAAAGPASPRVVNTSGVSQADLDALEQRLRSELAMRMTQVATDFDRQRRVDMASIQQEFGRFNTTAGAEMIRQRQELNNVNNLIRTSLQGR